ncbi:hypothetical protein BGZ76_007735 [Entomortierella beljakovae]|nr:hypothetical protein BGZ76_007735 [Entomortierella beljakovae]
MLVPQSEIIAYLRATAKTYNIYDKIQFQTRVTNMRWNEGRKKWTLRWVKSTTGEQGESEFDVVIRSAGVLRIPSVPKEFDAFEGQKWHTARWDHSVDLTGKRVGIVGAAASGIQVIPAIASKVQSLEVYSRTPSYVLPQGNFFYNKFPFDATMRRKLTPEYELASRHLVLSDSYYPALKRSNVTLHTNKITSIKESTIETSDGSLRELDVLILATGFDWISNFPEDYWFGRNGIDIPKNWGENPMTYFGTCVPHAPNYFLLWGPNTGIATMEVKQEAAEEFLKYADKRLTRTLYTTKIMPKFLNSKGNCRGYFWGSVTEYWWHLRKLRPELFHVIKKGEAIKPYLNGTLPERGN